jgi:hypothetical protein
MGGCELIALMGVFLGKREMKTKHVQLVLVTDPDTGGLCEMEIRKEIESGALVGIDGSYLEQVGEVISPYGNGQLEIQDDEKENEDETYPHYVLIHYKNSSSQIYQYANGKLAKEFIFTYLVERLPFIEGVDYDEVSYQKKVGKALCEGSIFEAMNFYHFSSRPMGDQIEFGKIIHLTEVVGSERAKDTFFKWCAQNEVNR